MAWHLVSATVTGFHIGEGTDVEPAPIWSQCLLVNGVRSWQLIIKHDLTYRLDGLTLGVRPRVLVPHRWGLLCGTSPFWRLGPLVNGVRSWQLIIKHDLTHQFHGRTLGVCPSVRVLHWWGHRCGTGPLLEPGSTCEWCQKLAIDYKTWFDTSVPRPPQCPCSTSVRAPMRNRPLLERVSTCEWCHKLAIDYKTWFVTYLFHDRSLGVRPCVRVPHLWGHQYGTSPLLEPGSTCEWCQKFAIDYIT